MCLLQITYYCETPQAHFPDSSLESRKHFVSRQMNKRDGFECGWVRRGAR